MEQLEKKEKKELRLSCPTQQVEEFRLCILTELDCKLYDPGQARWSLPECLLSHLQMETIATLHIFQSIRKKQWKACSINV